MRIATITNWAYGITVGLTLASGSAMLMASSADRVERQAVQQRQVFDTLSDEVENDAWALSDLARLYVVKPSPETLTQYQQLQQTDKSIEQRLAGLKDNGARREELALLQDGLRIADELQDEQQAALTHVARGDAPAAIAVLYGKAYETELERMQTQIDRFRQMLEHRAAIAIDQATERSRIWRTLSEIMVGLTALMFLFVLGFILKRRVLYPVVRLSDVVQRLASQDYAVETPHFTQVDEIGDMAQAIRIFRENGLARQRLEQQRDADWAIRELLARIKAILRRTRALPPNLQITEAGRLIAFGDWLLDTAARHLLDDSGAIVALSGAEYRLLRVFLDHPQRVLNRDQLLNLTQGRDAELFERSIDLLVSRLRQRLREDAREPAYIKTVRSEGYVLSVPVSIRERHE